MGLEWCMGMPPPPPPLVHFLNFISLLVYVSPPCASLPCHASFAAAGDFGWAKPCAGCACTGRMMMVVGLEWCMGMPPLVHFLNFISLLVYVSPPCASLPCHVSFAAAGEFGWAKACAGCACTGRRRMVVGLVWCTDLPHLEHLPDAILPCVMCSHHALLSRVLFPSLQEVSVVGQMAFIENACKGCLTV